jgi:hypothetical protein
MDEADGGYEPVKVAVPLVTGGSVHRGLAELLRRPGAAGTRAIDAAAQVAVEDYEAKCAGRNFDLGELESQSYVFAEQRALVEALVRVAGMRIVPRLLEMYEVIEVEKMDKARLVRSQHTEAFGEYFEEEREVGFDVMWRSIPDALMRSREDGDLYVLSWKTTAEFSPQKDQDARTDMQGLSEPWACEQRIGERITGVQMVYLVKGARRKAGKDAGEAAGAPAGSMYKTASPLIYGYRSDPSGMAPTYATGIDWKCSAPHFMRKSKWYPTGECPGDGRNHKRGDEWASFPVWQAMGVKTWLGMLDEGKVSPEAGDVLESSWAMPTPHWRTEEAKRHWLAQTRAAEARIVEGILDVEAAYPFKDSGERDDRLDEHFPQNTERCADWFGRKCPCWEICWGPPHVAEGPVASGMYQKKTAYTEEKG